MTQRPVVVSAVQITAVDGEKDRTVEKMLGFIDTAGRRGSTLVVLPELWTGLGFSDETGYRDIAEPIPGPVTSLLAEKARAYGMCIAGSMYEAAPDGRYHNAVPLIGPAGDILGLYRKTHLFDAPNRPDIPPGIVESKKVAAGDRLDVYGTNLARIGLSVCSDLRFPEVYREMALKGAEILVCASAFLSPRYDHWEFFLRARATENQCFVVASGQYGKEPKSGLAFVGRSMIVDPWGVIVATASDDEGVVTAEIDLGYIETVRERYPLMRQRRPELYSVLGGRA
ncbi:carbon-nitrogen hydrolase family protein [Elioraea sp.]|uniref:carbon-nitrogen hydrolase family protein n=1 Tax=Elioraea sp. TaxID=2185103 RepID=UPI0025C53992|nr:nitrilase-related carbon-nitrogen hydrolase [Elioraea sp.]